MSKQDERAVVDCDVLLIGAGIMSATVGVLLKELSPGLKLEVFEKLDRVAAESSDARNNAGTGHSALCELNYTTERGDGSIDVHKAVKVMESFEVSKQLWAYLVSRGCVGAPGEFIKPVPHMSFVWGEKDVDFLLRRFEALQACPLFHGMKYSEAHEDLREWMPVVMAGRSADEKLAATWSELGTDVNFGALTRGLFEHLRVHHGVTVHLEHEVLSLKKDADNYWLVSVMEEHEHKHTRRRVRAKFVFLGAGGGALSLLESSDIPEGEGYAGFPVSGEWLFCKNPALIERHHAKVYGKAKVGAPPMSVPHLDSRYIDGRRELLFGPFAGFSTKFLKKGSYLDLPRSLTADNILPMITAGIHNLGLTRYLIGQVLQSFDDKLEALREFLPDAQADDWELAIAGQRVQVIKKDEEDGGKLEFGTELISASDNSLAALLGASPGASTAVSVALELLGDCFPEQMRSSAWQTKLREMLPSYGHTLSDDPALAKRVRAWTREVLQLR